MAPSAFPHLLAGGKSESCTVLDSTTTTQRFNNDYIGTVLDSATTTQQKCAAVPRRARINGSTTVVSIKKGPSSPSQLAPPPHPSQTFPHKVAPSTSPRSSLHRSLALSLSGMGGRGEPGRTARSAFAHTLLARSCRPAQQRSNENYYSHG